MTTRNAFLSANELPVMADSLTQHFRKDHESGLILIRALSTKRPINLRHV